MKILYNIYANYCEHIDKLFSGYWLVLIIISSSSEIMLLCTMLHVIWPCCVQRDRWQTRMKRDKRNSRTAAEQRDEISIQDISQSKQDVQKCKCKRFNLASGLLGMDFDGLKNWTLLLLRRPVRYVILCLWPNMYVYVYRMCNKKLTTWSQKFIL